MTVDILIIGGGPAGSAAARLLAAWGHRVVLIDRPGSDSGRLAESIPPSADKALAAIGALAAVADAGFLPWRGNTVWWAGEPPRAETFPPGVNGYHVLRSDFDRRLRDLARESGADVLEGRVKDVRVAGVGRGKAGRTDASRAAEPGPEAAPEADIENGGRMERVTARFIIDASGRAGVLARQGLRIREAAPTTIALPAEWRPATAWPVADEGHTLLASYDDGWAWSVPMAEGRRQFTVMVDPARSALTRGASSQDLYLAGLAKVHAFAPFVAAGVMQGRPWGADASLYAAKRYAGPGFLLAGDAASTIDPLSSYGVKKALVSGWLAAIAIHTSLVNPAMSDAALAFFDHRERVMHASARRQAAAFIAEAAAQIAHPFWTARAQAPAGALTDDTDVNGEPDVATLARDPEVLAAFADLRERPTLRLSIGPEARIAPKAAVRGREIVMDDHLFLPAWPAGLRYLRGVDLVGLLRAAPAHADAGELYRTVTAAQPDVLLPDFLGALSSLIAFGALRHG